MYHYASFSSYLTLFCLFIYMIIMIIVWICIMWGTNTCVPWCVFGQRTTVESVLFFHLYVGSRVQTQVVRNACMAIAFAYWVFLPASLIFFFFLTLSLTKPRACWFWLRCWPVSSRHSLVLDLVLPIIDTAPSFLYWC